MNYVNLIFEKKTNWKSVAEFAKFVDIPDRTIRSYIYDNRVVPLDKFIKICKATGFELDKLIEENIK